jgi:dTDP-4-dehydrorhamnose reductase
MRLRSAGGLPAPHVEPISSDEYVTPARRPANSRLDVGRIERRFGIALPDWRSALAAAFGDLASQRPA